MSVACRRRAPRAAGEPSLARGRDALPANLFPPLARSTVLDPYYPRTEYPYADFKNMLVYNISATE